jgi:hypothetical protein
MSKVFLLQCLSDSTEFDILLACLVSSTCCKMRWTTSLAGVLFSLNTKSFLVHITSKPTNKHQLSISHHFISNLQVHQSRLPLYAEKILQLFAVQFSFSPNICHRVAVWKVWESDSDPLLQTRYVLFSVIFCLVRKIRIWSLDIQ